MHDASVLWFEDGKERHNRRECSAEVLGLQCANNCIMMPNGTEIACRSLLATA